MFVCALLLIWDTPTEVLYGVSALLTQMNQGLDIIRSIFNKNKGFRGYIKKIKFHPSPFYNIKLWRYFVNVGFEVNPYAPSLVPFKCGYLPYSCRNYNNIKKDAGMILDEEIPIHFIIRFSACRKIIGRISALPHLYKWK